MEFEKLTILPLPWFDFFMKTPLRLLLIVTPVVFLFGLWMGLSKPGWSPRVAQRDLVPFRVLCPEGVLSSALQEKLRKSEGLDLQVTSPEEDKDYFRLLYQNLADFDLVCLTSHHASASILEDHFDFLPLSPEWRTRRLHTDFTSVPIDPDLKRFWPLGWRIYLPALRESRTEAWHTTHHHFSLFLEEDFREVLHLFLRKKLLREDWLHPDHTDPLTTVLSGDSPTYEFVNEEVLRQKLEQPQEDAAAPLEVLYLSHTLWHSLPGPLKEQWRWGLEGLPGNLQVMGLVIPNGTPLKRVEPVFRALSRPGINALFSQSSGWASTLQAAATEGALHPSFLRSVPLTQFQWISGLDPSGLFWERIVASSKDPAVEAESQKDR